MKVTQIEKLNQLISRTDMTGNQKVEWLTKFIEEYVIDKLRLHNIAKSKQIQDLPNCTRVEVIDQNGRSYVNWKPTNKVRLSMQDDGRTAKIFIA